MEAFKCTRLSKPGWSKHLCRWIPAIHLCSQMKHVFARHRVGLTGGECHDDADCSQEQGSGYGRSSHFAVVMPVSES
jgi:hypothetical protein